jgi:hypothetical protein
MPAMILTRVIDNEYRPNFLASKWNYLHSFFIYNVFTRNEVISDIIPWSMIDV